MIKAGTIVFVKAAIIRQANDDKPEHLKGYVFATARGGTFVDPEDILVALAELEQEAK